MQHVGRCHPDHINVLRLDRFAPILDSTLKAKVTDRARSTFLFGVSADHEFRVKGAVWKQRGHPEHRTGVHLTHPAKTEDGNTEGFVHEGRHLSEG